MTREELHKIFKVKEAFKLPDRIMSILFDEQEKAKVFQQLEELNEDIETDFLREYFQNEQGDRQALKQDFTPASIGEIIAQITPEAETVADICAGTGGLSIEKWKHNKDAEFYFEEVSERTVPFLLLNLSIRGINATVKQGDSLENTTDVIYKLTRNGKYSDIEKVESIEDKKYKLIISNPPYSLKWSHDGKAEDERFKEYPLAPKSKADYAFILHELNKLDEGGTLALILPHGVLFRGSAEGKIRKQLIEENLLDTVIGLPDKLFLNTGIPVLILILKKNRERKDVYFIDASKEFRKDSKLNFMEQEHIEKVVGAYKLRANIEKFAQVVDFEEIEKNEFNLNIPRYVDTFEEPEPIDLFEIMNDLVQLDKETSELYNTLSGMVSELVPSQNADEETVKQFENYQMSLEEIAKEHEEWK